MSPRRRRRPALRLLSIDFDSFFPAPTPYEPGGELYDWGMRDAPFFRDLVWMGRAAAFLSAGQPLPPTDGREQGFWSRFVFAPGAVLSYADSHACLARPALQEGVTEVVSYDAHHDAGYRPDALGDMRRGRWYCDTWAALYQLQGAPVEVRYPPWMARPGKPPGDRERDPTVDHALTRVIDDGAADPRPFDRVFLCRSGAWLPAWCDPAWAAFLAACPLPTACVDPSGAVAPRRFDLTEVVERVEQWRLMSDPESAYNRLRRAHAEGGLDAARALAAREETRP